MKAILKTILLIATVATCKAQLGKTFAECETQYGPCLRDTDGKTHRSEKLIPNAAQAEWNYQGYHIAIAWMAPEGPGGPADLVVQTKIGGSPNQEEIKSILRDSSNGTSWIKKTNQAVAGELTKTKGILDTALLLAKHKNNEKEKTTEYYREDGANAILTSTGITIRSPRLVKSRTEEKTDTD